MSTRRNEHAFVFHPTGSQISETRSRQDLLNEEKFGISQSNDPITCWRSVKVVGILSFLAMLEGGLIGMGEWPYMHEIDPEATPNFFGVASSIPKIGRIIFALIFSYWTYRTKTVRPPMIAGRFLAVIGCVLYLCVEFFPSGRRFVMLICYTLFAIASSSATVLRVYLIAISSQVDRPRAFAMIALATTLSIVAGPVCQLAFSWIKYPGYTIFTNVHINLYTAPVWISSLLNFVSITVIFYFLEEKLLTSKEGMESSGLSFSTIRARYRALKKADIAWSLVLLCCAEKAVVGLTMSTLMSVGGPLNMIVFGWDGPTIVKISSISMAGAGLLSIGTAAIIMGSSITKKFIAGGNYKRETFRIPTRLLFLFGISIMIFLYVGTYPLPGISLPIPEYNASTGQGCNPAVYTWCFSSRATRPLIYIVVALSVMGFAMPIIHISIDTVYSKLLANIDQSLMQGASVVLEDLVMIVAPLFATEMFTLYGQEPLWIVNGVVTALGAFIWFLCLRKLKQYP